MRWSLHSQANDIFLSIEFYCTSNAISPTSTHIPLSWHVWERSYCGSTSWADSCMLVEQFTWEQERVNLVWQTERDSKVSEVTVNWAVSIFTLIILQTSTMTLYSALQTMNNVLKTMSMCKFLCVPPLFAYESLGAWNGHRMSWLMLVNVLQL